MTSENSEEIKEVTDFVASALLMNPCLEEDRPKGSEEGEGIAEVTWENQEENTEEEDIILHIELKKSVIQLNTNMCCMI